MSTTQETNSPITRQQILDRLWQLANLSPEVTRGNINGQLKAMTMIVAIECLIPNRYNTKPQAAPALPPADYYKAKWLRDAEAGIPETEPEYADDEPEAQATVAAEQKPATTEPAGQERRLGMPEVPFIPQSNFRRR